jgi:hypothetical protein
MKKMIYAVMVFGVVLVAGFSETYAVAGTINFDNGIAPEAFIYTEALRDEYASQGVHFYGPDESEGGGIYDGGAILESVYARSHPNVLAFNSSALYPTFGSAKGPETITFDTPMASVSIYASGYDASVFLMQAYDSSNTLVDSDTGANASGGGWVQLSVASPGITKVVLTQTWGDSSYIFDDLSYTPEVQPAAKAPIGVYNLLLMD